MKPALRYSVFAAMTLAVIIIFAAYIVPNVVSAQTNLGSAADQMCNTKCAQQEALATQKKNNDLNCAPVGKTIIPCQANTPGGGTVTGQCAYHLGCKALSASGTNGKSMGVGDLSSLMQALGSLMKALGQGGSGSGSSPSTPTTPTGCTQYYQVSTPSSDPCAYYVPNPTGSSINLNTGTNSSGSGILNLGSDNGGASGISDIGSGGDNSNNNPISNLLNGVLGGDNSNNSGATSTSNNQGAISSSTAGGQTNLGPQGPGGATGDIRVLPNGATIVITNQNNSGNSVTAGFLGTQTSFGNQPDSIVASWCHTRPWASNFLSFIIPATFFDSLCTLRGFQVGDNVQPGGVAQIGGSSVTIQNPPGTNSSTTGYVAGTVPQGPPISAQIWAVPAKVPLGGRTTIYWTSKNAASCTETSPDGSFSQNSLEGGGATVPLSGPTDFTISCLAPDGSHVTSDVLVNLAL